MTITTIGEWRKDNQPQEVELPSGKTALLKRVHLVDLAVQGEIPSTLVTEAAQFGGGAVDMATILGDKEKLRQWMSVMNPVVKAAFVEPKVGDEATDDQLGVDEIETMDKLAVFRWCNEGVAAIQPFRQEPQAGVGPAPDGESLRDEA